MSVIDNLAGLSNLELLKDELLLKKSKSVFDDIFPGLHGDNFGVNGLDLEDLEEQIDVEDLIKTADQIEFFPPQPHRVCVQENAIEKDEISRITDKITQGIHYTLCSNNKWETFHERTILSRRQSPLPEFFMIPVLEFNIEFP